MEEYEIMETNEDKFKLLLGKSDKSREFYIPETSRYLNTLIVGTKNTGKTYDVLPIMAKQDIENKECGATFIVNKKEMAFFLYSIAKEYGRTIELIKPSTDIKSENLLWEEKYNYDYINDNIINYKDAIKKKKIVIIDMEYSKYKNNAIRATAMLLTQLQLDMQDIFDTLKKPHFVYIDDSQYYIPFIETILTIGNDFNVGVSLYLQSRDQLRYPLKDYTSIIDNNIRNIILMNNLSVVDIEYYQKQFYDKNINSMMNRKYLEVLYETVSKENVRKSGSGTFNLLDEDYRGELLEKTFALKKKFSKKKKKNEKKVFKYNENIVEEKNNTEDIIQDHVIKKEEKNSRQVKKFIKKTPKEITEESLNNSIYQICDPNFDFDFD